MGQQRPPIDIYPEIVPARQAASNLRKIVRFWWVIALCVLLASVAGYGISARQPSRYDASAKVLLTNSGPNCPRLNLPTLDPERDLNTNVDLVKLTTVASRVRAQLHLPLSVTALLREVKAVPEGTSNVISITARDKVPARAKEIANAFARRYIVARRQQAQVPYKQAALLAEAQLNALTPAERAVRGADLSAATAPTRSCRIAADRKRAADRPGDTSTHSLDTTSEEDRHHRGLHRSAGRNRVRACARCNPAPTCWRARVRERQLGSSRRCNSGTGGNGNG